MNKKATTSNDFLRWLEAFVKCLMFMCNKRSTLKIRGSPRQQLLGPHFYYAPEVDLLRVVGKIENQSLCTKWRKMGGENSEK